MADYSIYVRAQDGLWYKNPIVVFDEGYLHFPEPGRTAELVVWAPPPRPVREVVTRALGAGAGYVRARSCEHVERPVPNAAPPHSRHAAAVYDFWPSRRIPVPSADEGCERYTGRLLRDSHTIHLDLPPGAADQPHEGDRDLNG